MKIDCSFPGGNIQVERIQDDAVWLHQDLRDTGTDWFYWFFRVSGARGKTVTFHFTQSLALGARGPAISLNGGATWNWLGDKTPDAFTYSFGLEAHSVLFAMTFPYLEKDWKKFIAPYQSDRSVEEKTLCVSARGRPVEMVRIGNLATPQHKVLLTCRHHACETMASYTLEGWIAFVLSNEPEALWLRQEVEFLAIPFMDKDGCEAGDQGKNRKPHDHNRDYLDSVYPETVALRAQVPDWSEGRLRLAFDLHCPWLRFGLNEKVYLVGSERPELWLEQQRYSALLEKTKKGPLPFFTTDNLPYGQDWNTIANHGSQMTCSQWASSLPEMRLATVVEVPYANAHDTEVNQDSARALGADLARTCAAYLQAIPSFQSDSLIAKDTF